MSQNFMPLLAPSFESFLFDPSVRFLESLSLSRDQLRQDLQVLLQALTQAYPGSWALPGDQWEAFLNRLTSWPIPAQLRLRAFADALADLLWEMPDGHLRIRFHSSIYSTSFKARLRLPSTGSNLADADHGEFWRIENHRSPLGPVPVVAISSFPQASHPGWKDLEEKIRSLRTSTVLAVDLRGHAGGDDLGAARLTSLLSGYEISRSWVRERARETPQAYALQANSCASLIWHGYVMKGRPPPNKLQHLRDRLLAQARLLQEEPAIEPASASPSDPQEKLPPLPFGGRLFVLIDAQTIAAGEWAALHLQKQLGACLVGENSYGLIHFAETGLLRLPFSGLEIPLSRKIHILDDGRFFEKTGIPPDLPVSSTDSLNFLLSDVLRPS